MKQLYDIILGLILLLASLPVWAGSSVLVLDRAFIQTSGASTLPPASSGESWQLQSLPDNWNLTRPRTSGFLWYQMRFKLDEVPTALWSLYFPSVSSRVAVYLNGKLLGEGTSYGELSKPAWQQPYFVSIPQGLLLQGENILQVHLMPAQPFPGYLGKMYVGPGDALQPLFAKRFALTVNLPQAIVVLMLALGVAVAMLWWFRKNETQYLWFAVTVLAWSVYDGAQFFGDILPISSRARDILAANGLIWFIVSLTLFSHRFLGLQVGKAERWLLVCGVCGGIISLLLPDNGFSVMRLYVLDPFLIALGGYILLRLLYGYIKTRSLATGLLAGCIILGLSFGMHDWLMILGVIDLEGYLLLHLSAPVLFTVVSFILNKRMTSALDDAEYLSLHLEDRVRSVANELELRLEQSRVKDRHVVLNQERERMMRDMHDGVGGMLVSAIQAVETGCVSREALARELRGVVDEFRLMIDSLDPDECGLEDLLANFRVRLIRQLQAQDIQLHWQIGDIGAVPQCAGSKAVDVLRVLQEATTNALKYARAKNIFVGGQYTDGALVFFVRDDGVGFQLTDGVGKGIKNMRYRAARIGAVLAVESGVTGTCVTLSLNFPQTVAVLG